MIFQYFLCCFFGIVYSHKVHVLPSPKSDIADGPHWDVETQSLYYADLGGVKPTLCRYDYHKNKVYSARIRNRTEFASFIIPIKCKKNQFAVGLGRNIEIIHWDGCSKEATIVRTVVNVEPGDFYRTNILNDAKADPKGRFYGGTERMVFCKDDAKVANGSFFMYTKKSGLVRYRLDVYSSNGLTWDTKRNKFYYIDSCKFDIKQYDWDPSTGIICNEKIAYDFRINGEFAGYTADGMAIDQDGLLWIGLFKGDSIIAVDPRRHKIVKNITIPAHQVIAAVFGGPNLDEIFVTTGGRPYDIQIGERDTVPEPPLSGHLFKVTGCKSRGFAPYKLKCI